MSGELISVLIAVLAIGATLAGLILTSNRGLREYKARMESCLDKRSSGLEPKIGELSERMVHLKGMHEAITERGAAS